MLLCQPDVPSMASSFVVRPLALIALQLLIVGWSFPAKGVWRGLGFVHPAPWLGAGAQQLQGRQGRKKLAVAGSHPPTCTSLSVPFLAVAVACGAGCFTVKGSGLRRRRRLVTSVTCRAEKNPYDVLGVTRGTSKSEVRQFFRKVAQTQHPDVNPNDPEAADRFQVLVSAYNDIMGDELFPDELVEMRVQQTKRYKENVGKEIKGGSDFAFMGPARFVQGLATVAFFAVAYGLSTLDQATLNSILSPPQTQYRVQPIQQAIGKQSSQL
mmetsp:Transcript_42821/g.69149  ORF Transcript_42821/g.69149 Transcript_42821/m.69149 type:complete len:268 (-) Transcript_42821:30-833(-)